MTRIVEPNRRSFIRTAGAISAAAAYVPQSVRGANDKINLGVIGVGGRGTSLLREVCRLRDDKGAVEILGVCDIYMQRLNRAVDISDGKPYTDYKELLANPDIDAVIIATPDHWHAQMSIDACNAGKDVYVEKPMTHTIAEAKDLWQTVEKTRRVLQVGSQTTSQDIWWKARLVVESGILGKLVMSQGSYHRNSTEGEWNYRISPEAGPDAEGDNRILWKQWLGGAPDHEYDAERYFRFRKYWDYSGGIATDLFYHVMAPLQISWGGGMFPYRVTGTGSRCVFTDDREVPDTFTLTADYKNGHHLVLTSSMANDVHIPGLIRGHEATLMLVDHGEFETETPYIAVTPQYIAVKEFRERVAAAGLPGQVVEVPGRNWARGRLDTSLIPQLQIQMETRQTHMENFLECCHTRQKPVLDVLTGFQAVVPICLSVEAYQRGKVMYFDETTYTMTEDIIRDSVHG